MLWKYSAHMAKLWQSFTQPTSRPCHGVRRAAVTPGAVLSPAFGAALRRGDTGVLQPEPGRTPGLTEGCQPQRRLLALGPVLQLPEFELSPPLMPSLISFLPELFQLRLH